MERAGYRKTGAWLSAVLASLLASSLGMHAEAAPVRLDLIPTLRLEEGWRSNVESTSENEISSLGTRVLPSLELRMRAPDDVTVRVLGRYERVWYHDAEARESDFNTWDLRIDSTGAWRFTPNFSVRPSAYFINTVDSYRRVQLLPSDDPVLPIVSATDYGNTKTQTFGGGLNFEYLVSPKLVVSINGNYSEKRFTDDDPESEELTNNSQVGGGMGFSYIVSPRTRIGMIFRASHYTFDDNPDTDTYSAGIQYFRQFSPVFRLHVIAGASYIKEDPEPGVEEESETAPSGSFRLSYDSDLVNSVLYGSATYSGSSGFGEATMQYTGGVSFSKRLTARLSGILSGYYQKSESVFTEEAIDINTMHGSAVLKYQPWEKAFLYLNGSANHQEADGLVGRSIDNYSVSLGITVSDSFNIF